MTSSQNPETKLTIIVPTHSNRTEFLKITLGYLHYVGCPFPVIVADSSPESTALTNEQLVENLKSSKFIISYRHFPEDITFYQKLNLTLADIKTSYVNICGDDDFLVPEALGDEVRFLDKHPDYSAVTGYGVSLKIIEDHQPILLGTRTYPQMIIDAEAPQQRLIDHFHNYAATFYSMFRYHVMKRIFQQLIQTSMGYNIGELFQAAFAVIHGKIGKLNRLVLVRRVHPKSSGRTSKLSNAIQSPEFAAQYRVFENLLADELIIQDSGITNSRNVIRNAFKACLVLTASRGNTIHCQLDDEVINIEARSKPLVQIEKLASSVVALANNLICARTAAIFYQTIRCSSFEDATMSVSQLLRPDSNFNRDFQPLYAFLKNIEH